MSVKIDLTGLKKLQRNIQNLKRRRRVPLSELCDSSFMRRHSQFSSLQEMVDRGPFDGQSVDDLLAKPNSEWDSYVRQETNFQSWEQMKQSAATDLTRRAIFKGL